MRKYISFLLKTIVVLASMTGIVFVVGKITYSYVGGIKGLMYFTNKSNIWIGVVCLIGMILMIMEDVKQKDILKPWMYVVKLVFTVSITLTGMVYCFLLAPTMTTNPWSITSVLTHVVVPLTSIIDFLIYDCHKMTFKYNYSLYALLPPLYYLGFSSLGFILNWDFGMGENYPYFFLDWGAPVGVFGISKELPHYIGTFYWLILLLIIVLGMSNLYIFVSKKIKKVGKNY